ncbi:MAG: hypothetical protein PWQ56_46 [Patescibacteria group bacterium]|nr:hypothetical protein [Patescibacteria group bacterium]
MKQKYSGCHYIKQGHVLKNLKSIVETVLLVGIEEERI